MSSSRVDHPRQPVLGFPFFAGRPPEATALVVKQAMSGSGGFVCFANAHVLSVATRDDRVRAALDSASLLFPDGWPVAYLQRRGGAPASRISGPDLFPAVILEGQRCALRHFLFGSTPDVANGVATRLAGRFPDAIIVGVEAPPLGAFDEAEYAARIAAAKPHVVWCALGAPKQELWMHRWAERLSPALLVGVGAAFDFEAGASSRAPVWMQTHGLEWMHRLASEPRRLAARYTIGSAIFITQAIREAMRSAP